MERIMKYLADAEGTHLHRIPSEKDITSAYGIYRYAHPDAKIFEYIDRMANKVVDSTDWADDEITKIDRLLDPVVVHDLAQEFYEEYLAGAHLECIPEDAKIAAMSCYTNSPKRYWKAVQTALVWMCNAGRLDVDRDSLSTVDGSYGGKTERALALIEDGRGNEFEVNMLLAMTGQYIELSLGNPDKFMNYLRGWYNRMALLAKTV